MNRVLAVCGWAILALAPVSCTKSAPQETGAAKSKPEAVLVTPVDTDSTVAWPPTQGADLDLSGPPPTDPAERRQYHRRKGEAGFSESMYEYALMCLQGKGGDKDVKQARGWLEKAAAKGNTDAMRMNGQMYYEGVGGDVRDFPEAIVWWTRAAEKGNAEAAFELGSLLDRGYRDPTGKVRPPDKVAARKWYELAAEKGEGRSQNNLGWMWLDGEIGEKGSAENRRQAKKWFEKAAAQGVTGAKNGLKKLSEGQ